MKLLCLFLIIAVIVIIIVGIVLIHDLPSKVAIKRGHPQADAIMVCSLLGLLIFPFWMFALLWAYTKPVLKPIELEQAPKATQAEGSI
ncbi:DUF3302 domain-containing protein [Colwellia echini]|uniref:DUF3302 domain-containing protein n=1 Tax=Colwellia echini TaxID=1982103 RepID=A0ABY3MTU9_9GAMM|nr:DUF3302 domain-containing protein [Colwellia echini]TYK64636.1 DUF3302 domain-containing protein [Colwellia echini]